ncbi:MAG TPA: hypothetical protein VFW66_10105 [Gemmatimonadales bacterium]|nr:hypothetical protein [Gemmatimonadales bacterium]
MKQVNWIGPLAVVAAAALIGISGCGKAAGAGKPDVRLEAKLPASFAQVSNVVELGDGRIAFTDTHDRLFFNADFKSGALDTVGTRVDSLPQGAPDSVYKFPGWVAHLAGDTVALVDYAAIRTTLWDEHAQPLAVLAIPPVGGPTPVLIYDHQGFGYKTDFTPILGGPDAGHSVLTDSVPVVRIQFASGRVDTVAQLSAPEKGDAVFGTQVQQVPKIFSPNDIFGVLPDGRVWVARGRENRIDWRGPGGVWIHGESRPYTKLPVTEADKARVIARVREQGRGHGLPDTLRLVWPFAEYKPPFVSGMATPEGDVWLQRSRASDNDPMVYDVYGPDAKWKHAMTLPDGVSLAGFGKGGAIYGIIKDGERRTVGRFTAG